jgi:transcriptional regulator with GAF, ATPase, and Fis domain/tetratricopeptide (TPR) repeat protein
MTTDERKRLIQREVSALERLDSGKELPERLARLERLADLHFDVDQFEQALQKYHDYRTLAVTNGLLSRAGALAVRIKEAWCLYERGDLAGTESVLREVEAELSEAPAEERSLVEAAGTTLAGYLEVRRGRYREALDRFERAFRLLQRSGADGPLANVQIGFGHVFFRTGEYARAREYYEDALASARRSSDDRRQVQAMIDLALVCKELSDNDRALYLLGRAGEMLQDSGNSSYRGHVLVNAAAIHFHLGNLDLSEEAYRDSLRIYLQTGQQQFAILSRIGLARIQILRGRLAEAKASLDGALPLCAERGYLREEVLIRRDLGDIERTSGTPEEALRLYREALAAAAPLGESSEHAVQIGRRIGVTELRMGRLQEAGQTLRRSLLAARRTGEHFEEALLSCALGTLASAEGRSDEFERMYRIGIDQLRRQGEKIELGKALVRHARYAMERREAEEGDLGVEIAEAAKIFREAGVPVWLGKARFEEARLLAKSGISERWERALEQAEAIFAESGDPRLVDQADGLRRLLEEKVVDHAVSGRNDHLAIHDLLPARSDDFNLKRLLEELVARTGGDRGMLIVFEGAEGTAAERASSGFSEDEACSALRALLPVLDRCRRGGRPFLSTAVPKDPRIPGGELSSGGAIQGLLVVPFQTSAEISGAIYLDRGEHRTPFGSRELDLVVGLTRSQRFALSLLSSRQKELVEENVRLRKQVNRSIHFDQIITESKLMDEVLDLVRKVAGTNVTVLIRGETGTGKQLIAQAIHAESPRSAKTFYSVNCATLPEQLLESELFGHAHGSFTGAHADKRGLLVEASGSTVFLDEIDKMNLRVQSKLLHVLEEKRIRPVGSNEYRDVDVRFICATNRNLTREVKEGRFLEDLYYRLNVINIDLPPLRERPEDILLLGHYFLRLFSAEMGKATVRIDEAASQALVRHAWPGNVRELRSEMRRVVVLDEDGVVTLRDLSPPVRGAEREDGAPPAPTRRDSLKERVERYEKELLRDLLESNHGNVTRTARQLGISRWGLHKKLGKHGLR